MKKDIIGLVAVRTESTRLSGKAFRDLNGKPLLENLVDRLMDTDYLDGFIVCTTDSPSDDTIEKFCKTKGVDCHRGEVKDVMGRFLGAAKKMPSEYVVRITGDNPLSDLVTMDLAFEYMKKNGGDYSRPDGVPLGTACEVIRTRSLEEIHDRTLSRDLTEYMTWFFEMAPFVKSILYKVEEKYYLPDLRVTVDYASDLEFLEQVFTNFNGNVPTLDQLILYCKKLGDYPRVVGDPKLADEIKSRIKFK